MSPNGFFISYPFITFWLECVATTPFNVVATHSNQKVIKGYYRTKKSTKNAYAAVMEFHFKKMKSYLFFNEKSNLILKINFVY
jgi:hypothetical protein